MLLCQAAEHCAQRRHQCRRGRHQCPRHKNARSQQARQLPQFLFSQVGHGHHAIPCFATGLWLLPLRVDCPALVLNRIERQMIEAYHPPFNTVYCPPQYRAEFLR